MEGAKACHLPIPAVKKISTVPPPARLICMCIALRTIAELQACQLQRSAQSVYCLSCRCLRSHAAPSAVSCRWGSARAGAGRSRGVALRSSAKGDSLVGSGWFGPVVETREGSRVSSGVLPAAVGTIICSQALSETFSKQGTKTHDHLCLGAAAATCSAQQ